MKENLQNIEGEIERLYAGRDREVRLSHLQCIPMEFIESQIKKTEEDFAKKIEPLERKRKFIIERKSVENKITIILGALGILVAIIIAALDWFVFV